MSVQRGPGLIHRDSKSVYAAVWRWHFYAGVYVAPFLILLATTGLLMLSRRPIERWQLGGMPKNRVEASTMHQPRWDAARAALAGGVVTRYQPGRDATESTRVTVTAGGRTHTVFVDASTASVAGSIEDADRIDLIADRVHGTLLMGSVGDRLVEVAASLGILLVAFPMAGVTIAAVAAIDWLVLQRFPRFRALVS